MSGVDVAKIRALANAGPGPYGPASMYQHVMTLLDEVSRLRAGEADSLGDPAAWPSPAEWLRMFNDAPAERRLLIAERAIENAQVASRCFQMDHERRVAEAERQRGGE